MLVQADRFWASNYKMKDLQKVIREYLKNKQMEVVLSGRLDSDANLRLHKICKNTGFY